MDRQERLRRVKRLLGSFDEAAEGLAALGEGGAAGPPLLAGATLGIGGGGGLEALELPMVETAAELPPALARERALAAERSAYLAEGLRGMQKLDLGRDDLTPGEADGLEAIVLLTGRPALLVQNGDFLKPPKAWVQLESLRPQIVASIARVGRVEVGGSPNFDWLGTGFLAAPDVVITNRHVAVEFSRSAGNGWSFRSGMSAGVDFNAELGAEEAVEFAVREIVGIHEDHDLAVLRVEQTAGDERLPEPLEVAAETPATLKGRQVYVVGYPAWDGRRNDPEPMLRIFANIFNVKRLQPGEVSGEAVDAGEIFHDCSTLGGNSGSPVIDLETHRVIGLHFGGRYLERNHAVPLWTLRDDPLVRAANLNFQ